MPSTPEMQDAAKFMYGNYGDQLEQLQSTTPRAISAPVVMRVTVSATTVREL